MRFLALSLLLMSAGPVVAQTTPITDRPGRWVSVGPAQPEAEAPVRIVAPALEIEEVAPVAGPEPVVVEPAPSEPIVRIATPTPDTLRPLQRPTPAVAVEEADVALEVAAPDVRPVPRPQTAELADVAAALADELATAALNIVTTPLTDIPPVEVAGLEVFDVDPAPVPTQIVPLGRERVVPADDFVVQVTEVVVSEFPVQQPVVADGPPVPLNPIEVSGMSAVLLPAIAQAQQVALRPSVLMLPGDDAAPIRSRPRPRGPEANEAVLGLGDAPAPTRLAAVLMPGLASVEPRIAAVARMPVPPHDPFPMSALPPSALPEGPAALERVVIGPAPHPARMAAVLVAARATPTPQMDLPAMPERPLDEDLFVSPERPPDLPAPDPFAIARLVEETGYCWRLANLGPEARWAELRVDVALDETNHASALSIQLTGFGRVLSSAAEEAYRAAHDALLGCGAATAAEPATAAATLVFDRNGIVVR